MRRCMYLYQNNKACEICYYIYFKHDISRKSAIQLLLFFVCEKKKNYNAVVSRQNIRIRLLLFIFLLLAVISILSDTTLFRKLFRSVFFSCEVPFCVTYKIRLLWYRYIYIYIYYLSLFGNFDLSISEPDLQKIYKLILHYLQYLMWKRTNWLRQSLRHCESSEIWTHTCWVIVLPLI